MSETTQSYQASAVTGITVQSRDGNSENFASWPMEQKPVKPAAPTALTSADTAAALNGTPYTDAARLLDVGHSLFYRFIVEFDTTADRTATITPVYFDSNNAVLGLGDAIQFSTKKVGTTTLLENTAGRAVGGMEILDCKGAAKVSFILNSLSGGSFYWFASAL